MAFGGSATGRARAALERLAARRTLTVVRRLNQALAMMTLALWAMAAMHCALEHVPGFGFLASCCAADATCADESDRGSDACSVVEDGTYRSEDQTASAPQPLLALVTLPAVLEDASPQDRSFSLPTSESPPELPRLWQFAFRTARSPRAPSLHS